jgi:hypothetical protein
MRGRIADAIVLAVAAAIALFALSVAVSNSHPAGQYPSTLGESPKLTADGIH